MKDLIDKINLEIKHQEKLAEEYIQERDNQPEADSCLAKIEALKWVLSIILL